MKILNKITQKDLKLNKKRTIGTLIGIILSSFLIIMIGEMFYTMQNTMFQNCIQEKGYYHMELINLRKAYADQIKDNNNFSHYEIVYDVGSGESKTGTDNIMYGHVLSMSKETAEYLRYNIKEGRFPNNSDEIIVNEYLLNLLNLKIGDKIELKTYYRVDKNGDYLSETESNFGKKFYKVNEKEREFEIVGYTDEHINLITTGIETDKIYMYSALKNPNDSSKNIDELLGTENFNQKNRGYRLNINLLGWETFQYLDKVPTLYAVGAIIILIILITSIFAIRNSFAISTNEKVKMYGMLSSIGATKKQIKRMVLYEGMYLGVIGIFIGTILGSFATWILVKIINNITTSSGVLSNEAYLQYKFSWIPIIIAIIVGAIMIYLSVRKSAKKASEVTPIQNIKNAESFDSNKIKLDVPNWIRKRFKIGGVLAYKNLKRNKEKYKITVISLTISIFIFITVSSIINYIMEISYKNWSNEGYNVIVSDSDEELNNENNLQKLESLEDCITEYKLANRDTEKNGNFVVLEPDRALFEEIVSTHIINKGEDFRDGISTTLQIYNDNYFKAVAKKLNRNYDDIKDKVIIINQTRDTTKSGSVYRKVTNYKEGENLKLTDINSDSSIDYKIGIITNEEPLGFEGTNDNTLKVIVNKDYFNVELKPYSIYYKTNQPDELVENIKNTNIEVDIRNLNEEIKTTQTILAIVSICTYSFIIIITFIGVTSVFNTISSNVQLRRREFANLKSIGMTKKEFNHMIYLESCFYSFKSLIYGTILGVIFSYIAYRIMATQWDFGYIFPVIPILIAIIFVISIVFIIMKYSVSKINKQNIIETIRNENI